MTRPGLAWLALAGVLLAAALLGWPLRRESIDWQPALAGREPWRALSAVGVHYSLQHLAANLAALGLLGAAGLVMRLPARLAAAWLAAWPLTHFGLLARPELAHYGGLSGVIHAGVAVLGLALVWAPRAPADRDAPARRGLGGVLLAGLALKLVVEAPWGEVLRHPSGWDIAVAPLAHATGALAGLACAALALAWPGRHRDA